MEIVKNETSTIIDSKEHFGFRDGISRPTIKGLRRTRPGEENPQTSLEKVMAPINAGEFILGYENEYDRLTEIPIILDKDDSSNILSKSSSKDGIRNLGTNGTYLVYREIEQEVFKFWKYLETNSEETGKNKTDSAIKLGSKMVGRWPSGLPHCRVAKH